MDPHTILALSDAGELVLELSTIVWNRFDAVGYDGLKPAERVFHCVWWLEAEVNNGGFDQFFFNSAGDLASQTVDALRTITAYRTAEVLLGACSLFPGGLPSPDRDQRQNQLDMVTGAEDGAFRSLDHAFYESHDNLAELLGKYVLAHREAFSE